MAKLTKEQFIESLKEMNIKEVMELVEAMKEEFGIDPSAVAVAAAPAAGGEASAKSEFKVTLKTDGGQKVNVIKVVKELLGLGLMEAKKLVDNLPAVLEENAKEDEAKDIKEKLSAVGAEVVVE
ncbi:50S ribosomal protein L7/L12 [Mesomycoplasma hyorhinis]|uniref:50S ribosomal protein L7/L12 n=1 Tax=Mesomycoplasma hyorhinis TaxID=2100 RepID=UPI001C050EF9|nr:50S ribosomal protein L7/L12 [Mesomycoplasma hyorhinis]